MSSVVAKKEIVCIVGVFYLFSTKNGVDSGTEDSTGGTAIETVLLTSINNSNHILSSTHAGIMQCTASLLVSK